jgi:hypothetical protein
MLVEACGGTARARQLAARWTRKVAARSAQTVTAVMQARLELLQLLVAKVTGAS